MINIFFKLFNRYLNKESNSEIRKEYIDEMEEFNQMVETFNPLIKNYHLSCGNVDKVKVVKFMSPSQILQRVNLNFPENGESIKDIAESLSEVFEYTVHTSHPRFLDKLFTGIDPMNMYSEMIVGLLNTNIHTYAASSILSVIEVNCITELGKMCGYEESGIDGIFVFFIYKVLRSLGEAMLTWLL
jgi:sulfinoalanine decarboxylase